MKQKQLRCRNKDAGKVRFFYFQTIQGDRIRKLSIVSTVMLVILSAGQASALPGVYNAGSSTMNRVQGECEVRTISMDGTGWGTSPLISGGFCISISSPSRISVNDIWCYDEPPLLFWPTVEIIPDPGFTCVVTSNVDEGVPPSSSILICDVEFCGMEVGSSTVTIGTIPEYDTWVARDETVYDPTIDADVIEARVVGNPCECVMAGAFTVSASAFITVTETYMASGDAECENAPAYVYYADCILGTIDSGTGVLTVPATTSNETCNICAVDTANTDINTGDPVECCLNIEIWSDW